MPIALKTVSFPSHTEHTGQQLYGGGRFQQPLTQTTGTMKKLTDGVRMWKTGKSIRTSTSSTKRTMTPPYRRWMTRSTRDLAFATSDMYVRTIRTVLKQLVGSDDRPAKLSININILLPQAKCFPRWYYKKANNWLLFEALTDMHTKPITSIQKVSNKLSSDFNSAVLKVVAIPSGALKDYRPY